MAGPWPGGRSLQLLLGAAVLIVGGIAVASATQLSRLKRDLVQKQQAITSLRAENATLQNQLASVEEERKTLSNRLDELRGQLAAATGELTQLRASLTEVQGKYEDVTDERSRLDMQVKRLTKERDEATDRIQKLDDEKRETERVSARLRERFVLLDRDYQKLVEKVVELEQQHVVRDLGAASPPDTGQPQVAAPMLPAYGPSSSMPSEFPSVSSQPASDDRAHAASSAPGQTVELPPIVVRKEQAGTGLPVRARLVEANVQHRFVVLDKGSNDGVRVGMTFDVIRAGAIVAQASAVRVRPQLAACDVVTSRSADFPQVGDLAVQRNP